MEERPERTALSLQEHVGRAMKNDVSGCMRTIPSHPDQVLSCSHTKSLGTMEDSFVTKKYIHEYK